MRTTCACPTDGLSGGTGADLSNCVLRSFDSPDTTLGNVQNVAILRLAGEFNINVRGKVVHNRFCALDSREDIEIVFNATFKRNFVGLLAAPDTLAVFAGARFKRNRIVNTKVGRLQIFGSEGFDDAVVSGNQFDFIEARSCESTMPALFRIKKNFCRSARVAQLGTCGEWDAGFSCPFKL